MERRPGTRRTLRHGRTKADGHAALLRALPEAGQARPDAAPGYLHLTRPARLDAPDDRRHPMRREACRSCRGPVLLRDRFCAHCGAEVHAASPAADDPGMVREAPGLELRQVTAAFLDLVGSTEILTALGPEDGAAVIAAFQRRVAEVVRGHGGLVVRHMGDGALVSFGVPHAHEDDAERGVRAALDAVDAIAALALPSGARLRARAGVATGLVLAGDVAGLSGPGGLDLAGEALNLAARLQAIAEPGVVLVSDDLRKVLGALFAFRELGCFDVKGWASPVPAWQALRPAAAPSRFEARTESRPAPLVGRARQLERLLALWRLAAAGQGRTALVTGEAGIGKSRLVTQMEQVLAPGPSRQISVFCAQHQQDAPLQPVVQAIERACGFAQDDAPDARWAKLRLALPHASDQGLALISHLLTLPPDPRLPVLRQLALHKQRSALLEALLDLIVGAAQAGPLLIILEDAQWSDLATRELLAMLTRRAAGLPVLLVVTARPGFDPDWAGLPGVEQVAVEPLTSAESAELVRCVTGTAALPADVVSGIVARADGVPLYLEEVTKTVLGAGPRTGPAVPTSIHASLLARLDRLEGARPIAEVAAAIGRDFSLDLLRQVCGVSDQVLAAAMERLLVSGLVLQSDPPGAGRYRFKHALISDAAYGIIVRARRRALHQRIAQAMEAQSPQAGAAEPQLLAHHYSEAGLPDLAAAWRLRAGLQCLQRSAAAEALAQLRQALALLETLPDTPARGRQELDVLVVLVKVLFATEGHAAPNSGAVLVRARLLSEQLDARPQLLAVLFGQWVQSYTGGGLAAARRQAGRLLQRGEAAADEAWVMSGCYALGFSCFALGAFGRSRRLLERGISLFDPAKRGSYGPMVGDPRVVMRSYLSWTLMCVGDVGGSRRECEAALAEALELRQAYAIAIALNQKAYSTAILHGPEAALATFDELRLVAREHGFVYYEALENVLRGWCLGKLGETRLGLGLMRDGRAAYCKTSSRLHVATFLAMEAEVHQRAGDTEAALASVAEAERVKATTCERWDAAEVCRLRGELHAARGEDEAAEAAFRRGRRHALAQGAQLWSLRIATPHAELLVRAGRRAEAAAELELACSSFPTSAAVPDEGRARRLLASLSP